jgi:gliding motility-associated-like protein
MYPLKFVALILLASFSKVFAQIGPPDLRCLEALSNGDVILTWTPANDPGNNFSHYKVYTGIQKKGTFVAISPTVAPVTATGMLHAAAGASSQPIFYYVRTFETDGDSSKTSDTLQTIFLNVITHLADPFDISYNNTSTPLRVGGNSTFSLTKEYPIGSVNNLSVTTSMTATDNISGCKQRVNYMVLLQDPTGCISKSNPIVGTYDDNKYPDQLIIDSISVLPDGRTILSWEMAPDLDVDTYNVLKRTDINNVIASIAGRTVTSYIYEDTEALTRAVGLSVSPQDSSSCVFHPGLFDTRPVTMHLSAEYDHCRYRTTLTWNAYMGMKKGIKEYRIYYALSGGTYTLIGNTQSTSFIHNNVDPKANVCYFVRVVNGDESITASSNRTCFFTQEVGIPGFFYMRTASVNRDENVNILIAIDTLIRFADIDLMRSESSSSDFVKLTSIPYKGESHYSFTDLEAETAVRPYYYKAILRDSCGNARTESNICRTIFLQANNAGEDLFKRRLTWTDYEGFAGGVQSYNIYRIVNDDPGPQVIATTFGNVTTYTDDLEEIADEGATIAYMVQAVQAPLSPFPYNDLCNSNKASVFLDGRIYVPNAFAPNGINRIWKPVTHFVDKKEYNVRVFNRWGAQVFRADDDATGWDGVGCSEGIYVYLISYKNARGEYREQKGTVLLVK